LEVACANPIAPHIKKNAWGFILPPPADLSLRL
jgi:hypothetical protein